MARRVPVIQQAEAAECGLACLAMVAAWHGDERGLAALRQHAGGSLRGATLQRLMQVATQLKLHSRALRIELQDLQRLPVPAVLHWNLSHFVVLVHADRHGIEINDPAVGRRRLRWSEVSDAFTGVALELWPAPDFAPAARRPVIAWRRLLAPGFPLAGPLARIIALAIGLECLLLLTPLYLQGVIDQVLVSSDRELLWLLGGGFAALLLVQTGLGALRGWAVQLLSQRLGVGWQRRLFGRLLGLRLDYFHKRSLGDVNSRLASLGALQNVVGGDLLDVVLDGLMATLALLLMLSYSATLTAITAAATVLYLALSLLMFSLLRERSERLISAEADELGYKLESIRGVQTLKLLGCESTRNASWSNRLLRACNRRLALSRANIGFRSGSELLTGLERIVVIALGALAVLDGALSVGMLVAFLAYRDLFARRASLLVDRLLELRLLSVHLERISDIALAEPEFDPANPGQPVDVIESIELREVCFRHAEGDPWILDRLSLRLQAGESVAVVGASGSGKSTLVRLLTGLLQPVSGEILVNGVPLSRIELGAWRRCLGVVMQDDQLFAGTIRSNIALSSDIDDSDAVEQAARLAAVHDDIGRMPMGYASLIGDMGSALSGGQKQRLLLARALYRQPQLLLLDEATSHLDLHNERLINQAIANLSTTRLIVAHRPETIASADRVLELAGGRIIRDFRNRATPQADAAASA